MRKVKMGPTTLSIPAEALGIMRLGDKTIAQAQVAIQTAYDNGITFFDSADIYGKIRGNSERNFGRAFKQTGIPRDHVFIQSKTGIIPGQRYDFSKTHIIRAVDDILYRMQIDYLDSLLLHRPDALMEPEEVAAAFDQLQAAGKVRFFGVSNFNSSEIALLQSCLSQKVIFDQVQFGLKHTNMIDFNLHTNLTDQKSVNHDGQLLNYLQRKHITVQCWSPFQYGFFAGTFINNSKFPKLNAKLAELAQKYGVGKNAIAAAWILRYPAQMQVLVGSVTPAHITDAAKGADIELSRQEWYDLYLAAGANLP